MNDSTTYLRPEVLSKISRLELRARSVVEGFVSGLHKSPYHGFSIEFAQHREYVPGDDVRHIDWRVYAKADRFFIKQYEEETNLRSHILLDCSGSMAYPEHEGHAAMTKWEYAATVASSIAYLQSKQQDAVGLTLFDHEIRKQLPAATSTRQLTDMISLIESQRPADKTNVKVLFSYLADHIKRRSMLVLVSDLLTDVDDLIAGLQRLRYTRHEVLVLHVLDHDELEFPFTRQTMFEGIEIAQHVLSDPQSLRRSYLAAMNGFVHRVRSWCVNNRVDYVLLSTRDPLDVALSAFLAQRMHAIRAMNR